METAASMAARRNDDNEDLDGLLDQQQLQKQKPTTELDPSHDDVSNEDEDIQQGNGVSSGAPLQPEPLKEEASRKNDVKQSPMGVEQPPASPSSSVAEISPVKPASHQIQEPAISNPASDAPSIPEVESSPALTPVSLTNDKQKPEIPSPSDQLFALLTRDQVNSSGAASPVSGKRVRRTLLFSNEDEHTPQQQSGTPGSGNSGSSSSDKTPSSSPRSSKSTEASGSGSHQSSSADDGNTDQSPSPSEVASWFPDEEENVSAGDILEESLAGVQKSDTATVTVADKLDAPVKKPEVPVQQQSVEQVQKKNEKVKSDESTQKVRSSGLQVQPLTAQQQKVEKKPIAPKKPSNPDTRRLQEMRDNKASGQAKSQPQTVASSHPPKSDKPQNQTVKSQSGNNKPVNEPRQQQSSKPSQSQSKTQSQQPSKQSPSKHKKRDRSQEQQQPRPANNTPVVKDLFSKMFDDDEVTVASSATDISATEDPIITKEKRGKKAKPTKERRIDSLSSTESSSSSSSEVLKKSRHNKKHRSLESPRKRKSKPKGEKARPKKQEAEPTGPETLAVNVAGLQSTPQAESNMPAEQQSNPPVHPPIVPAAAVVGENASHSSDSGSSIVGPIFFGVLMIGLAACVLLLSHSTA